MSKVEKVLGQLEEEKKNLMKNPEEAEQLTDEELDNVAGGKDITINIICRPKEKD